MGFILGLFGLSPSVKTIQRLNKIMVVVLAIAALAAALFGAYMYGRSTAYKDGYQDGVASQQQTIKDLTDTINGYRQAVQDKAQDIQGIAGEAAVELVEKRHENEVARNAIVGRYEQEYQKTTKPGVLECTGGGWSELTTKAVNELLDTQLTPVSYYEVDELFGDQNALLDSTNSLDLATRV